MKKIINILLTLFILCGCSSTNKSNNDNSDNEGSYYVSELVNFKACDKNIDNDVDNEEFNIFLNKIFLDTIDDDYLNMCYIISDYHNYDIEKPEVTIGTIKYGDNSTAEEYKKLLSELNEFDTSTLSYRQQYDYDSLKYSILETIATDYYSDLSTLFSSSSNIVDNLITNFTEFTFYNREQVEDYIVLMEDIDRYLEDALDYTATQIENKIYISDGNIDYSIDYNNNFVSKVEDNELIVSFNNKLDELDFLSEEEKETYKEKNKEIVINEVIPVINKISETLQGYYGLFDYDNNQLVNIDSDYAKLTYMLNGSNNYSIDDVYNLLMNTWDEMFMEYYYAYSNDNALDEYEDISTNFGFLTDKDDEDIIEYLISKYSSLFPELDSIEYTVDRLDSSVASDTILAYYIESRIDDLDNNIIKVNPYTLGENKISAYCTLAHEGIPGHLYQHNYYWSTSPNLFRSIQNFVGYSEGWAVYASEEAMEYFDCIFDDTKTMLWFDNNYYFIMYSIADIGINYYGWDKDKTYTNLQNLGLNINKTTSNAIYETLVDMPGVYCRYGIGYAYFRSFKDKCVNKLGSNFDEVTFNEYLLKNGPLPFNLLSDCVNEYLNKYANQ